MTAATPRPTMHVNEPPIVALRNVHKRFGALVVLDGVSLALRRGQTSVVIGESGTGKSVLLKHMIGLLRPDVGEVYFKGERIDTLGPKEWTRIRRHFGVLFQGGALFDSMTAVDNVAFPLREHRNISGAQARRIAMDKLQIVGLEQFANRKPAELSGGQRKRVGLARAIALDPEVILYDEPTTGLDPIRADLINELILHLQHRLSVTSVVVTHDMASAYKVADRIIMLHQGKFIADGTPDEIRQAADERVRRFVEGRAEEHELASLHMEDRR